METENAVAKGLRRFFMPSKPMCSRVNLPLPLTYPCPRVGQDICKCIYSVLYIVYVLVYVCSVYSYTRAREGCETPVFKRPCSGVVMRVSNQMGFTNCPYTQNFGGVAALGMFVCMSLRHCRRIVSRGVLGAFPTVPPFDDEFTMWLSVRW